MRTVRRNRARDARDPLVRRQCSSPNHTVVARFSNLKTRSRGSRPRGLTTLPARHQPRKSQSRGPPPMGGWYPQPELAAANVNIYVGGPIRSPGRCRRARPLLSGTRSENSRGSRRSAVRFVGRRSRQHTARRAPPFALRRCVRSRACPSEVGQAAGLIVITEIHSPRGPAVRLSVKSTASRAGQAALSAGVGSRPRPMWAEMPGTDQQRQRRRCLDVVVVCHGFIPGG